MLGKYSIQNVQIQFKNSNSNSNFKKSHVPFRESTLTRILQSSLGGNSRTAIICNASLSSTNGEHTASTLRFGSCAIKIRNHATVNEVRK